MSERMNENGGEGLNGKKSVSRRKKLRNEKKVTRSAQRKGTRE